MIKIIDDLDQEFIKALEDMKDKPLTNFEKVGKFMQIMGQEVKTSPEFPSEEIIDLRLDLIREEFLEELYEAIDNDCIVEVADTITDILYVVYGAGHAWGIPVDECFAEVQRSNMSKLDENGQPIIREDGKIQKGPNYSAPDLESILGVKKRVTAIMP